MLGSRVVTPKLILSTCEVLINKCSGVGNHSTQSRMAELTACENLVVYEPNFRLGVYLYSYSLLNTRAEIKCCPPFFPQRQNDKAKMYIRCLVFAG